MQETNHNTSGGSTATLEECPECYYPVFLRMHGRGCPQGRLRPIPLPDADTKHPLRGRGPCDIIIALLEDYPYTNPRDWAAWNNQWKEQREGVGKADRKIRDWLRRSRPDDDGPEFDAWFDEKERILDRVNQQARKLPTPAVTQLAGQSPVEIMARLDIDPPKGKRVAPTPAPAPTDSKHPPLSEYVVDMSFDVDATKKLEALLWRDDDDETLIYSGKLNSIFGKPASGKTWISLIAVQNALANLGRVLVLDYEDNAVTFKTRMLKLGGNPAEYPDQLKYVSRTDLMENPDAVAEVQTWFVGAEAKAFNLVVVDSVGSAGCPSDGADIMPWYDQHVGPWRDIGITRLLVDHVPKQDKDRPRGGIGSQHKLAMIDGAALYVSGAPWTKKGNGRFILTNHKDRQGDLPAPAGKPVAVVIGEYKDIGGERTFAYRIISPDTQDDNDTATMRLAVLDTIYKAAPDGVVGLSKLREMVTGNNSKIGAVLGGLIDAGMVFKDRAGSANRYTLTGLGVAEIPGACANEPDAKQAAF